MTYQVQYNRARNVWVVWRISGNGNAEIVKTFKTESAATKWAARQ